MIHDHSLHVVPSFDCQFEFSNSASLHVTIPPFSRPFTFTNVPTFTALKTDHKRSRHHK
jgi:hypothetical protein